MSLFFMIPAGSSLTGVVDLNNASRTNADTPVGNLVTRYEVRYPDGTCFTMIDDDGASAPNFAQVNSGTDWIIPNAAATGATYHVKMTTTGGGTTSLDTVGGDAENTWEALNVTRGWQITESTSETYIGTISISDDGGSTTLASAQITLNTVVI